MRVWCARFTDRRAPKRIQPADDFESGMFAEDLSIWVHKMCKQRRTVWAYAHNLGFDLCTSDLVVNLTRLGWTVSDFAIGTGSPFIRLRHGDSRLCLSDSWSWFGVPLDVVADALGMTKPPLPKASDTPDMWLARCKADTEILHTAMLTLMDWWEAEELGVWNVTGSASGWNAMRHISSPQQILIRPDDDECDHDRRAIYGGRRSVWYTGRPMYGHFVEVDIEKAYTAACYHMPLPIGRQATFTSLPIDHKWLNCERWGVIAEVTVNTPEPIVPVRIGRGVWYPVGRFKTTLAGPDIKELRDLGYLEAVGPGWLHKLGHALKPWAGWCIKSQLDATGAVPEVAKLVHRMWGRSAVGKWNQRGFQVIDLGPSPNIGWNHEEAWHHSKGVPASIVDFAGNRYQVAAVNQSDNAYPAILAFVESYVRVSLGRAMRCIGDADMVACDTDGYICRSSGIDDLARANEAIAPFKMRPKRNFRRIKVIGPQHMELDRTKRRSGIPASAEMGTDGKLHAWTWPKYAWQLANGRQGAYVRPAQAYKLASTYAPGWTLSDGSVRAVELALDADGTNRIVPFPQTRYGLAGQRLADDQNRHLERYRHGNHT